MRNTKETIEWYEKEVASGSREWRALCLKLCRTARGIGAVYPSAVSAQAATPNKHRIYDLDKVKQGMVAYFDDRNDSNPYGHIVTIAGRDGAGNILSFTNDVKAPGAVSVVDIEFFERAWGDKFQFASDWLNGQVLELNKPAAGKPSPGRPLAGAAPINIRNAIKDLTAGIGDLKKAIEHHKKKGNTRLYKALERDLDKMIATRRSLRTTIKNFK